jgi:phage terminase large subunit-like protein
VDLTAALSAIGALHTIADKHAQDPLSFVRWTPPQRDWLSHPGARKLLRAGNQLGKTYVGLAEVIHRALGTHPHYRTRKPPVEIWIVCTSWAQSVAIMAKFWALVPRSALRKGTTFDPRSGFGKDNPAVVFTNGSVVRFKTTNQGPEALAGATIDYVHIDEPCDEDVYRELDRRVLRRNGQIGITLTPVNRPTEWLRKLVELGAVHEVHARLTEANLTPVGGTGPLRLLDGTPMDAAWIAKQWAVTPATYAGVILDGEWETRPEGVFYSCFDTKKHVSDAVRLDPRQGPIRWALGFDYAAANRDFGHCVSLSQVQVRNVNDGTRDRVVTAVYTVDELTLHGSATTAQSAIQTVAMLQRHGLRWIDLYSVHGDNPVASRWVEKSNMDTMRAIAKEIGVSPSALSPRILNAKDHVKATGSFDAWCRWVYERLANGEMMVHPRCTNTIKGFGKWDYTKDHPFKDILDAQRYALKPWVFSRPGAPGVTVRLG